MERAPIARVARYVQSHLLWFVIGSYVLAALLPRPGLRLRSYGFGDVSAWGEPVQLTASAALLASLLFIAGLCARFEQMRGLVRRPLPFVVGLMGNLFVPLAILLFVSISLRLWPDRVEAHNCLLGLAVITAMPIAGSSIAWAQNTEGNLALSLSLIAGSTLLSPLTTPLILRGTAVMTSGDAAQRLIQLGGKSTGMFLAVVVAAPSLIGMGVRQTVGPRRMDAVKPVLSLASAVILLLLCYSNAAVALPEAVAYPDADYLILNAIVSVAMCAACFVAGWRIAARLRTDRADQTSLMFALGMNNNGTGLVLAGAMLTDQPQVMLPIIFYTLVQHLTAGVVNHYRREQPSSAV
jgi:bile acid:Na+ symporter, BASS family